MEGKRMLIVEDDTHTAEAYSAHFRRLGMHVQVAADGEAALALMPNFQPDIILLDLIMPKKSGVEVFTELKQSDSTKNIPILVLTNIQEGEELERAVQAGINAYYVKADHSLKEITNLVEEALQ